MSSNLKVNTILPSTGDTVSIAGIASITSSVSIASSCTATTFYGSGANLTGITGTTINNNADNRIISGSGTANTLEGESTFTYNSGTMFLSNSGGDAYIKLSRNASVSDGTAIGTIDFCNNTGNTTNARVAAYASGGSNVGGHIYFETRDPSNSTLSERVRIKSNGYVGIGTNNPMRPFVISDDGAAGAEFNIPDNFGGLSLNLYNRTTTGFHPLSFNAADIRLGINAIEKARLASGGQFLIGTTAASGYSNRLLTVNADDGDAHIEIRTASDHAGTISFSDTNAGTSKLKCESCNVKSDKRGYRSSEGWISVPKKCLLQIGPFCNRQFCAPMGSFILRGLMLS